MPTAHNELPTHLHIGRGDGVDVPIGAVIHALQVAAKASRESAADNHDPDSLGGVKTTAGEVCQDVGVFAATFAATLTPALLDANGIG